MLYRSTFGSHVGNFVVDDGETALITITIAEVERRCESMGRGEYWKEEEPAVHRTPLPGQICSGVAGLAR